MYSAGLGGTWGEEDDTQDQSNVWTAPPANNAPGPNTAAVSNNSERSREQMQWAMNNGPQQATNNSGGGGRGGGGGGDGGGGGGGGMWNSAPSKSIAIRKY